MILRMRLSLVMATLLGILALCGLTAGSDANLLAHWTFDEGSGAIAYDSVGSNDGIIYGADWALGQVDGALEFDGTHDYVDVGNYPSLKPPLPVTVSAWIKLSGSGKLQRVVSTGEQVPTYYGVWLELLSTDRVHIGFGDGTGSASEAYRRSKFGASVLDTGRWYHVVGVIRGATDMDVYVDGVDDGGNYNGSGGSLAYSDANSAIGYDDAPRYHFDGLIDDVRIYDSALSAEEVERLYWAGIGGSDLAIFEIEQAMAEKGAALDAIDVALERELVALGALEELLGSKDYGDLKRGDVVKAKQGVHWAMQHQEQSAGALERSVEQLEAALEALGVGPEPEIVYEVLPCDMNSAQAEDFSEARFSVRVKGSYIYFEDMVTANCCADEVELEMEVEDYAIKLYETEETPNPCWCICPYPVNAVLGPFGPGTYTVEVYEDFGGFIGSTTVTIGPKKGKKEAKGLLKVVTASRPKT